MRGAGELDFLWRIRKPRQPGPVRAARRAEFVCWWFVSMYFHKFGFVCIRAVKRDAQASNKRAAN